MLLDSLAQTLTVAEWVPENGCAGAPELICRRREGCRAGRNGSLVGGVAVFDQNDKQARCRDALGHGKGVAFFISGSL